MTFAYLFILHSAYQLAIFLYCAVDGNKDGSIEMAASSQGRLDSYM